jgi:hypothetical protein
MPPVGFFLALRGDYELGFCCLENAIMNKEKAPSSCLKAREGWLRIAAAIKRPRFPTQAQSAAIAALAAIAAD